LFDFVVIGGGPIGSRVAYKLAEMGHQVAVLEKRDQIGQKPCCTGIISQECVDHFSIPPQVFFRQVNSAKIFSPSGDHIRVFKPQTQACIVDRCAFDNYLADQARAKGAEYLLGCRVEGIKFERDRVVLEVESGGLEIASLRSQRQLGSGAHNNGNWEERKLEARAVVLASGFSSPLIRKVGLKNPDILSPGLKQPHSGDRRLRSILLRDWLPDSSAG
jgi:flavin-dependent dehydrogenase